MTVTFLILFGCMHVVDTGNLKLSFFYQFSI